MNFQFDRTGFTIDGEDQFLNSGEFHYFRVPAEDWKRRMELFKAAGGNSIATYVPWIIHEPEEGNILFGDIPNRDLVRFLELAKEVGLKVTLRPGPYQYSELLNAGLPSWLMDNYPEIMALNVRGESFEAEAVSYLHPVFLEKARIYFKAFADVVRPYMGDPVVMLQTDNELAGVHVWFGSLDYHPTTMGQGTEDGRYPTFLKKKYGTLATVNAAYELNAASWSQILPIDSGDRTKASVCRRIQDYFDFYCGTMAEYMSLLASWLKEDGLCGPFCHNSGNATLNSMFVETVNAMGEDFLLGSDHYYTLNQGWPQNNPTPQWAIRCYYSIELMRLLEMPPSVLEMPGGSPSDTPPILPEDLLACYMTNLAMGMKGVNYYVYTGGPNFPNTGTTCDIYDYNALVHADGTLNPTYESLKTFGQFLQSHSWMQRGSRRGSAVIGFEWGATRCDTSDWTSQVFTRTKSWEFARLGLIYTMMCSKYAPELITLDQELDLTRPLIIPCPSAMSAAAQQNLIEFVEAGGKLALFGTLPETDEDYNPCTLLRDYLGNPTLGKPVTRKATVNDPVTGNIYGMTPLHSLHDLPQDAAILCTEVLSGDVLGFRRRLGKGEAAFLACHWKMQTFDQPRFLEALLDSMGAAPCVESSNRSIFTAQWEDDDGHELTMVLNLYSSPQKTDITVYSPDGTVTRRESVSLAPMEVKVLE